MTALKSFMESLKKESHKVRLTEKDEKFYGINDIDFIWHGEWSDPEVRYQGKLYNYWELEDALWEDYKDECREEGKEASEEEFDSWVPAHAETAYMYLDNMEGKEDDTPMSLDDLIKLASKPVKKDEQESVKEDAEPLPQDAEDFIKDHGIDKKSEIYAEIERIANELQQGHDVSYGELAYLQDHQDFIKAEYSDDPQLWEWAGIPEEEWSASQDAKAAGKSDWESFLDTYVGALKNPGVKKDSVTFQEDDDPSDYEGPEMEKCETIVPWFPGFYESPIKNYYNSRDKVGQIWCDIINDAVSNYYPSLNYKFQSVHSPRAYNFETDSVYANATFNKNEIIIYIRDHMDAFKEYAKNHLTSYDGYMSFVTNNADEFLSEMSAAKGDDLNKYLQAAVEFVLEDDINSLQEELYDSVLGNVEEDLVYIVLAKSAEGMEVYFTYKGEVSGEISEADVAYDEAEAEKNLKAAQEAYPQEQWEIRGLTERDLEDYDPSYWNN